MRSVLLLASLAIAGCANLPVDRIQNLIASKCEGLPIAKEGACVRAQLDDGDPDWQRKGNADIFEAMLTAYDRTAAQVSSGTLTEQQAEVHMKGVRAALAKASNQMGGARREAIAQAVPNP
jgi:hypothetical protein